MKMESSANVEFYSDGASWLGSYLSCRDRDPILLRDLEKASSCIQTYASDEEEEGDNGGVDGIITVDPTIIKNISKLLDINDDLIVIGKLSGERCIARTFSRDDQSGPFRPAFSAFVVFNMKTGEVLLKFEWSLEFYYSNFGFGRPGGCAVDSRYIRFTCSINKEGNHAVVVGPAICGADPSGTSHPESYPSIKFIDVKALATKDVDIHHSGVRMWPVNVIFDRASIAIMMCVSSPSFRYDTFPESNGRLLKYDFATTEIIQVLDGIIFYTPILHQVQHDRVLCVQNEASAMRTFWIINISTLEPVSVVDFPYTEHEYLFDSSEFWHTLTFETLRCHKLHVLFWKVMIHEAEKTSFIFSLPLPPKTSCDSLQQICRRVILLNVRVNVDLSHKETLCNLPLPEKLISFIEGYINW